MRKIRKLSLFGILGVAICTLIFFGISSLQANSIGKKPVKPPEATWAVELPVFGTPGTMLYGDGFTYINNDIDVRIKVEKGSSRIGKGQTAFHYYFSFKLLNPTGRFAGFQNVYFDDYVIYPDEGPSCIFPGGCSNIPAICMECFLNRHQPYTDNGDNYEYFNLKFQVGQGSFTKGLGYIIDGIEDENWEYDVPVKFTSYSDWIKIRVQNQEDFLNPETEFHNVECDERNYDDGIFNNMNIWIVRLEESSYIYHNGITSSDGVWRICVGSNPYTTDSLDADLLFQEQYTQRAEGKGKKGGVKTVTIVPLEATGNFSFYIDFIKNPTTN